MSDMCHTCKESISVSDMCHTCKESISVSEMCHSCKDSITMSEMCHSCKESITRCYSLMCKPVCLKNMTKIIMIVLSGNIIQLGISSGFPDYGFSTYFCHSEHVFQRKLKQQHPKN